MMASGGMFMSWPVGVGCGVGRSVADMGRVAAFQPPSGEEASKTTTELPQSWGISSSW